MKEINSGTEAQHLMEARSCMDKQLNRDNGVDGTEAEQLMEATYWLDVNAVIEKQEELGSFDAGCLTVRTGNSAFIMSDHHRTVVLGGEFDDGERQTTDAGSPASLSFIGGKTE